MIGEKQGWRELGHVAGYMIGEKQGWRELGHMAGRMIGERNRDDLNYIVWQGE